MQSGANAQKKVMTPVVATQMPLFREKSKRRATDASMATPPKALHADHSFHDGIYQ